MPRSADFLRQLNEQLLEQLEDYARQPGRMGKEVFAWLEERKVKTSERAVFRWLQDFRLEDRTRRASDVARQYLEAARQSDPVAITQASLQKFEELIFDHLAGTDETDAGDLLKIAMAMKAGLGSRREVIELKQQQAAAIKEAESKARNGASADDVVGTIKKALGFAA